MPRPRQPCTGFILACRRVLWDANNVMLKSDRKILVDSAKRLWRNQRIKRQTGLYPLELVLFYVTMRCNAKCSHCFCWEDLNVGMGEYTLEQVEQIADSMPPARLVVLTGGEPTLRKDLGDIFRILAERKKAETMFINTNGLQTKKIVELAEELKRDHPETGLEMQVSLDGMRETHDKIRGVPGNFDKAVETIGRIYAMKQEVPNLGAHALTVITADNYTEMLELNDYLRETIGPDVVHGFELVRDVDRTAWNIPAHAKEEGVGPQGQDLPPVEAFDQIARDLKTINRRSPVRANAFHVHNLAQLRMVATGREQYKCVTAGQSVAVLYSDGRVAHCEFTLPFANLADFDFNFEALWHSDAANARRDDISGCHCTHGCFHGKAVEYSWRGLLNMAIAGR